MELDFWRDRWAAGQTAWDQGQAHPTLVERWDELGIAPDSTVLVPLCGASVDLAWLAERGHRVIGTEASEIGVRRFFEREFPDAVPLIPALERDYTANPVGHLGTVRCRPWSFAGRVLLVGDAAHAIVPFHGQGMNAAFEDCAALDDLIDAHRTADGHDWPAVFAAFEAEQRARKRLVTLLTEARLSVRRHMEER